MRTLPVAASVGHNETIRKKKKNLQKKKNRGIYTAGGARNSANV